jgi:hypothetical protein
MFYLKKYIKEKDMVISLNSISDFMGFSTYIDKERKDDIIFKHKRIKGTRVQKGTRCDNVPHSPTLRDKMNYLLKQIWDEDNPEDKVKYDKFMKISNKSGKEDGKYLSPLKMCMLIEYILRHFDNNNKNNKRWFFMTAETILYGIIEIPNIKTIYQKETLI